MTTPSACRTKCRLHTKYGVHVPCRYCVASHAPSPSRPDSRRGPDSPQGRTKGRERMTAPGRVPPLATDPDPLRGVIGRAATSQPVPPDTNAVLPTPALNRAETGGTQPTPRAAASPSASALAVSARLSAGQHSEAAGVSAD